MVVIEDLPSVDVSIRVNGEPLPEYDDPEYDGPPDRGLAQKYIESKSGSLFSISELFDERVQDLGFGMDRPLDQGQFPHVSHITGAYVATDKPGKVEHQLFKFRTVTTVDDANKARIEADSKVAKDLGVITVTLKLGQALSNRVPYKPKRQLNHKLELSEKALKGRSVSQGTEFVAGSRHSNITGISVCDMVVLGRYKFFYRSRGDLKNEFIIPRRPSPAQGDANDVDGLSPDEIRRLACERLVQINGNVVKSERRKGAKRERSPSMAPRPASETRYKIIRTRGRDTIDLTDD